MCTIIYEVLQVSGAIFYYSKPSLTLYPLSVPPPPATLRTSAVAMAQWLLLFQSCSFLQLLLFFVPMEMLSEILVFSWGKRKERVDRKWYSQSFKESWVEKLERSCVIVTENWWARVWDVWVGGRQHWGMSGWWVQGSLFTRISAFHTQLVNNALWVVFHLWPVEV